MTVREALSCALDEMSGNASVFLMGEEGGLNKNYFSVSMFFDILVPVFYIQFCRF